MHFLTTLDKILYQKSYFQIVVMAEFNKNINYDKFRLQYIMICYVIKSQIKNLS